MFRNRTLFFVSKLERMNIRPSLKIFSISKRWNSYVTTPIFYANAVPHLGHLYTAVLADAAHRWEILKDPSAKHIFSTGTDEHGIKILRAAEAAKKEPQLFCDEVSNVFFELFKKYDIQNTHYIRTTQLHHKTAVKHIWNILEAKGLIYKDVYKGWYSIVDECFYPEKDVEDAEIAGKKVKVVKSTKTVVEWIEEDNYMYRLSEFRDKIKLWLETNDVIQPRHYLPATLKFLEMEEELSISRCRKRLPWGITVPTDSEQTIYVWLDALVNYLSVVGYPNGKVDTLWPPTCQIIGKDILKFHAIYWPAFLLGADLPLPERIFVHGHWLVDNTKMSKSIGNVVDPFEAGKSLTYEGLRYFLLKQGVPSSDSNYTYKKALEVINSDLVNNIGNLLSRGTVKKLNPEQLYLNSELNSQREQSANSLIDNLNELSHIIRKYYDELLFYKAIEQIMNVTKQANQFFQSTEPWKKTQGDELSSILHICYETVRIAALLLQPVVPHYSAHALDRLGIRKEERNLADARFGAIKDVNRRLGSEKGPFIQRLAK